MARKNETAVTFRADNKAFNAEMKQMQEQMKSLKQEFKLQQEQMKLNSSETQKLESKLKNLGAQYEIAKQKTQATAQQLDKAKELFGDNSTEVTKLEKALKRNQIEEQQLANSIALTTGKLSEAVDAEKARTSESTKAAQALEELKSKEEGLKSSSEKLNAQFELQKTQMGENASETDKLKLKLEHLNKQHDQSVSHISNYERQLEEAKKAYGENSSEIDKYETQLLEARNAEQKLANEIGEANRALASQESVANKVSKSLKSTGESIQNAGEKMKTVGDSLTKNVTLPLIAAGGFSLKAAIDFEDAFAGVRKTIDGTPEEFQALSTGIRNMAKEIPVAATEIAGIAEAAGQLGIKKKDIMGFTRTMADLNIATNMTSEEAATSLARFANITKMSQKDFDRLGSTIVALGNNFATTEKEIVEMALRLAGAGSQVGMTEANIMALATALSSVGIEAEMGGSAISRVMVSMQVATSTGLKKVQELGARTKMTLRDMQLMASNNSKGFTKLAESLGMTKQELMNIINAGADLEGFSKVAGMTSEQFVKAFKEDAMSAMQAFISGLANAEAAGDSAINMLQEMGITEIRLRDSLLRAGGANKLFTDSVRLSTEAWNENNALTKEAEQRYNTTSSQLKVFWNRLKDISITLGDALIPVLIQGLDALNPLIKGIENGTKWFSNLDKTTQKTIIQLGLFVAALGPVTSTLGRVTVGVGGLTKGFGGLAGSAKLASASSVGLGGALAGLVSPIGLVIAALGVATASGISIYNNFDKITQMSKGQQFLTLANGAGIAVIGIKSLEYASRDALETIKNFGDGVSKSTNKALVAYSELDSRTMIALNKIAWGHEVVTLQMKEKMTGLYNEMTDSLLSAMDERHIKEMEMAKRNLENVHSLNEEEKIKALQKIQEHQVAEEAFVKSGREKILSIYEKAALENRSISESERKEIESINKRQYETAVEYMSKSQVEQAAILETLKSQSSAISAQQASEVVKNSLSQKDKAVKHANEQYIQTLDWAKKQYEEVGSLSKSEYDEVVANAKNQRDEAVLAAQAMHQNVVKHAKEQSAEHVNYVDWETGEIKSKWEITKSNVISVAEALKIMAIKKTGETAMGVINGYSDLKKNSLLKFTELVGGVRGKFDEKIKMIAIKMSSVDLAIKKGWQVAQTYLKSISLSQIGKDIVAGLAKGITSGIGNVKKATLDLASKLPDWLKTYLRIKSPSRRIRDEVGVHIPSGLAAGIDKNAGVVNTSAKKLAANTTKTFKEAFNNAQYNFKMGNFGVNDYKNALEKVRTSYAKTPDQIRKINLEIKKVQDMSAKEREQAVKRRAEQEKNSFNASKSLIEKRKSMNDISLKSELESWERVQSRYKKGTKEREEADQNVFRVKKEINDRLVAEEENYQKKLYDLNASATEKINSLQQKYLDSVESRKNQIMNSFGLFEEVTKSETSGENLLAILSNQVKVTGEWMDNLDRLSERRMDRNLLSELENMGPKAASQIAALVSLTDTQLDEYNRLWRSKSAMAKYQAISELEDMRIKTELEIEDLKRTTNKQADELHKEWMKKTKEIRYGTVDEFKAMNASMTDIGKHTVTNLIKGMTSMQGLLANKAKELANGVADTISNALNIPKASLQKVALSSKKTSLSPVNSSSKNYQTSLSPNSLQRQNSIQEALELSTNSNRTININVHTNLDGEEVAKNQFSFLSSMFADDFQMGQVIRGV